MRGRKSRSNPKFDREGLTYEGSEQTSGKWTRLRTYGGKLVENIVQAIARDCLAAAMTRLEAEGYQIVMHIHDEVVIECPPMHAIWTMCAGYGATD